MSEENDEPRICEFPGCSLMGRLYDFSRADEISGEIMITKCYCASHQIVASELWNRTHSLP
jgi:hypothetical protein